MIFKWVLTVVFIILATALYIGAFYDLYDDKILKCNFNVMGTILCVVLIYGIWNWL